MASSLSGHHITPEQYLQQEETAEFRSEYHQGSVFPMEATSLDHSLIVVNLITALRGDPAARNCLVYGPGARVYVKAAGLYTYPDVTLICGKPTYSDDKKQSLTNPILLIEVLSPSTRDYDGGRKFQFYRTLPSLREYMTVAQDVPHVEHYTRQDDNRWLIAGIDGMENTLRLESIQCELPFSTIYSYVEFDA